MRIVAASIQCTIVAMEDLKKHPFIGFVEEAWFTPELNYSDLIGAEVEPRVRGTDVLAPRRARPISTVSCARLPRRYHSSSMIQPASDAGNRINGAATRAQGAAARAVFTFF